MGAEGRTVGHCEVVDGMGKLEGANGRGSERLDG